MEQKEKADAANIGSKPKNQSHDFSRLACIDYGENQAKLQAKVPALSMRDRKIVRLYKCFACRGDYGPKLFSCCRLICKNCQLEASKKGDVALRNFRERILNRIGPYLRGTLR